ncbi:MAG: MinD/ParA family protein [Endozoicomonadaceae bacterium]|nr:MinD/ParA family protein [Endozoicomonadaceae bacterium]MBE8232971.1 MinD/ParA family protein [Endozoicomonadaceae bacterium]
MSLLHKSVPHVIAVSSGKGGVGKTTMAINLAKAFHELGQKTLLIDGDFGLANIHLFLGEESHQSLESALSGKCAIQDVIVQTSAGFSILPSSRGDSSLSYITPQVLSGFITLVDGLQPKPEVLIIDHAGGSIREEELQLIAAAHAVLLVTTPELIELYDTAEYIRQLYLKCGLSQFSIIANKTKNQKEMRAMMIKLQQLVGFDVDVVLKNIGYIPCCENKSRQVLVTPLNRFEKLSSNGLFTDMAKKVWDESTLKTQLSGLIFFYEQSLNG